MRCKRASARIYGSGTWTAKGNYTYLEAKTPFKAWGLGFRGKPVKLVPLRFVTLDIPKYFVPLTLRFFNLGFWAPHTQLSCASKNCNLGLWAPSIQIKCPPPWLRDANLRVQRIINYLIGRKENPESPML